MIYNIEFYAYLPNISIYFFPFRFKVGSGSAFFPSGSVEIISDPHPCVIRSVIQSDQKKHQHCHCFFSRDLWWIRQFLDFRNRIAWDHYYWCRGKPYFHRYGSGSVRIRFILDFRIWSSKKPAKITLQGNPTKRPCFSGHVVSTVCPRSSDPFYVVNY